MFLPAISALGSIAPIGGRGIGWLDFWNLRRGSGRKSGASSTWPGFVGPTGLCVPAVAAGKPGGCRLERGCMSAAPATGRSR